MQPAACRARARLGPSARRRDAAEVLAAAAVEFQEGVAFYGRAGQAILKSLQRLRVDPMAVYGTNCLKFAGDEPDEARAVPGPGAAHRAARSSIVVMGEHALEFLNEIEFPLSDPLALDARRAPAVHADDRGARHARHRRVPRRAAREDGVLERLQAARRRGGRSFPRTEAARRRPSRSLVVVLAYYTWHDSLPASRSGGTSPGSRSSSFPPSSGSSTSGCRLERGVVAAADRRRRPPARRVRAPVDRRRARGQLRQAGRDERARLLRRDVHRGGLVARV